MLGGIEAEPDHVVGKLPPLWAEATVEKVAINAVMSGAGPEAMPVLVAALEAMLEPAFNLYGVQATTHPVAPLLIVHGSAADRLGMHSGPGVFGPGVTDAEVLPAIPLGRMGDPEVDVGRAAVFLAGPDAAYITGTTLMVDGGFNYLR